MIRERLTAFRRAGVTTFGSRLRQKLEKENQIAREAMDLVARHNRVWKG